MSRVIAFIYLFSKGFRQGHQSTSAPSWAPQIEYNYTVNKNHIFLSNMKSN